VIYMAAPLAEEAGVTRTWLGAIATPLVVLGVWYLVRRIRRSVES